MHLILSSLSVLFGTRTGPGKAAGRVESLFKERFSGEDAVVFPSARCGIRAVLTALELKHSNEVLVTGYTCSAVPDAVAAVGATPVYADVDAYTFSIDPARLEERISPRTRALLVQHTYGIPAGIAELEAMSRRHNLHLLEDACLALGSACEGRSLGSMGDASIFSFELSKTVTAGWGGVVVTRLPGLGQQLREIRAHWGNLPRGEASSRLMQAGLSGFLYRPGAYAVTKYIVALLFKAGLFRSSAARNDDCRTNADAGWNAVLRQMTRLDATLEHSRRLALQYSSVLRRYGWDGQLPDDPSVRLCRFPVLVADPSAWVDHFGPRGFEIGRWFDAPVSPPSSAGTAPTPVTCPVGTWLGRHMINLPLHRRIGPRDADRFCNVLEHFLASLPEKERFAIRKSRFE